MIPDITNITNLGAKTDPKAVAAKVQGMFLEVILKTMEDSVDAEGGLFGSSASSDIYRGMLREHLAEALARQMNSPLKGGFGNTVVIETQHGRKMLYGHNNHNFVQVGDWVSRGDTIAEVGSTGRATGPHVHFEVKF